MGKARNSAETQGKREGPTSLINAVSHRGLTGPGGRGQEILVSGIDYTAAGNIGGRVFDGAREKSLCPIPEGPFNR